MKPMHRARGTLLGGMLLVALAFALLRPDSPPLYDGLRIPDEPYRYLSGASATQATPAPTSANREVVVAEPIIDITTSERRPQAFLLVQTGSLQPVSGTAQMIASLTPVPIPDPGPRDGVPLGNAYHVQVRNQDGHPIEPSGEGQRPLIQLRIPSPSTPRHVVLELSHQGAWLRLKTIHTGDTIYGAALPFFGTVVAVYVIGEPHTSAQGAGGVMSRPWPVLGGGLVVVMAALGLVALGRRRHPSRAPR
jgi:hypothetical protein